MAGDRSIHIALHEQSYDVTVRRGLLADVGGLLRRLNTSGKAIVVTDNNIAPHFLGQLRDSLQGEGFSPHVTVLPSGEEQKAIENVVQLYDQILPLRVDRQTPILAMGGGVVGDITGFVAATVLRGLPFVQVPTTLLSMVDASVGGKTGVNHRAGKNLIGAFHQPIAVFVDPDVLRTLPPREIRSGLAECIKHDVIRDADGFANLEANVGRALALDLDYLNVLIAHNIQIKAKVVMADPFERGERAHLNFGHTFGHAIETTLNYSKSHGECIGLGMSAASHLAVNLKMIDDATRQRIVRVIKAAQLPTHGLSADPKVLLNAMSFDKKVKAGKLRFVLPDRIGNVVVCDDVPLELIHDAFESLMD
ncbi:3-dehydroquinate synthase [soil metagenome]